MQHFDKTPAGEGRGSAGHVVDDTSRHAANLNSRARDAASIYNDRGWCPLPLPAGRKFPPPDFTTGNYSYPSTAELGDMWDGADPESNTAGRMPTFTIDGKQYEVIGIDVDHYDGKTGADTLADLVAEHGSLPRTYRSTSRSVENPSGIQFFVVEGGLKWVGKPGPDIEIIQRTHRYAVAWPSTVSGRTYRWYDADGNECDVPDVRDLPFLPESWVEFLRKGTTAESIPMLRGLDADDSRAWLAEHIAGYDDAPTPVVADVVTGAIAAFGVGAHDAIVEPVWHLVTLAAEGHHGLGEALRAIRDGFYREVLGGNGTDARRDLDTAEREWDRSLTGAVGRLRGEIDAGLRSLSHLGLDAGSFDVDLAPLTAWLDTARYRREHTTVTTLDAETGEDVDTDVPCVVAKSANDAEADLAEIFADHYRGRLRWVDDRKSWARYDDETQTWQITTRDDPRVVGMWHTLRESVGLQCLGSGGEFVAVPGSLRLAKAVVETARGLLLIDSTDFDNLPADEWPCANGILNNRTHELRPYTPSDLVTERFAVDYNPDAEAPEIWEWMVHAFSPADEDGEPDLAQGAERARFVLRWHVAGMVPELAAEVQEFLNLNGPGGSGKNTFGADMPRAVFGRYARPMDGGYFQKRNASGKHRGNLADSVAGARLVTVDEAIGTASAIDGDFLKKFTGSATMHVERKHGTPGEAPRPLVTFLTNDTDMNFGKQDTGIRRRMIAVALPWGSDHRHATGQVADAKGKFRRLFESEGPGVLNLYLDALAEVRANYAEDADPLRVPASVADETAEIWRSSSFVGRGLQHFRPIGPDETDAPILSLNGVHAFLWDLAEATEPGGAIGVGLKGPRELRDQIAATFETARVDKSGQRGKIPGAGGVHTRVHRLTANESTGAYIVEEDGQPPRVTTDEVDEWRADHPRKAKVKVARTLKMNPEMRECAGSE
ncbi:bifunctional DNA primase/polymerase [Gordonia sp. NPDC003376]